MEIQFVSNMYPSHQINFWVKSSTSLIFTYKSCLHPFKAEKHITVHQAVVFVDCLYVITFRQDILANWPFAVKLTYIYLNSLCYWHESQMDTFYKYAGTKSAASSQHSVSAYVIISSAKEAVIFARCFADSYFRDACHDHNGSMSW